MRNVVRVITVALLTLAMGATAADAAARQGAVAGVTDGDTIRVKIGARTAAVDLLGVRAATGCGTDGTATLRALLPRGAKVRLVRDGARGGAYVYRGSTFVNRELIQLGAAKASGARGLRRARGLRAAQRSARALRLGVWSCDAAAVAPVGDPAGGVDTAENRADLDRFVRGFRFTMRESFNDGLVTHQIEMVVQFCADGRLVASYSAGGMRESMAGTWKLHDVTRRDDQLFLGRFEVTFEDGEDEPELIHGGRRADGAAVFGDEEDQSVAERAPADGC